MKKYLILLLNISILLSNNISLVELFSNDYPVWLEFPVQSIDEDCQKGCTEEEFLFDLESYVSDPDEDDTIIINDPILLSGSASISINEFILKIIPNLNYFGDIIVELEATDGELSSSTNFTLQVLPINDLPIINNQLELSIDEDCGEDVCNDSNRLVLSVTNFDTYDVEGSDDLVLHIDISDPGEHYTTDGGLGIFLEQDYNGQIIVPVYVEDGEGGQSEVFDCIIDVTPINDSPYFSNLGDITIDEDNSYQEIWASDISSGADNEDDNLEFIVIFDENLIVESYSLSDDGTLIVVPTPNANGLVNFSVYLSDEDLQSDEVTYTFALNPINDIPLINSQSAISINEDCGEDSCDGDNKLVLDLSMLDTEDPENPEDLVLYIDQDNIDEYDGYTTDGDLGILLEQDYNGQITVPVYVEDLEGGQSQVFPFDITIAPINDSTVWMENVGIGIYEDCLNNTCSIFPFDLSPYVTDVDDDLTIIIIEQSDHATFSIDNFNLVLENIEENYFGDIDITLEAQGDENPASIIWTVHVQSINDAPVWNEIPDQQVEEDCGSDSCDIFPIDLGAYASDIETENLIFTVSILDDEAIFSINDFELNLDSLEENYFGVIEVILTASDEDEESRETTFSLDVQPINDIPYFSDLGDIIIDEDNVYEEAWAFDISSGADNEIQDIFFIVNFEDLDLIQESNLTPEGLLTIIPSNNKYGETTFNVKIVDSDSGFSDDFMYSLVINSINDIPLINSQIEI